MASLRFDLLLVLLVWFGTSAATRAEPPVLDRLFPVGGQIGTTVEVLAEGKFPVWPVDAWTNHPGLHVTAEIPSESDGPRRLKVGIADDAVPGLYWIRLFDRSGATQPRPFVIGTVAEAAEFEPNQSVADAEKWYANQSQKLRSVTINGCLGERGDVDVYPMFVAQGTTLVADLDAHATLGSPVDAVLQILSPDGFVVAQNDDQQSLDPRVATVADRDGVFFVRLFGFPATPDSSIQFAGSPDYLYRLNLSTESCVAFSIPLVARVDRENEFKLFGWNLSDEQSTLRLGPATGQGSVWLKRPGVVRSVQVPVVDRDTMVAAANSTADEPQMIEFPACISGQLTDVSSRHAFRMNVSGGTSIRARLTSRSLGFPLDAVLTLSDSNGKQLAQVDDSSGSLDAVLDYKAEADSEVMLAVHDLHGQSGEEFAYRLDLAQVVPDFGLKVKSHQVVVAAGAESEIVVSVERRDGFAEPIEVACRDLPAGVTCEPVTSAVDTDTAAEVKLQFRAAPDVSAASLPIAIVGTSMSATVRRAELELDADPPIDAWLTVTVPDTSAGEP